MLRVYFNQKAASWDETSSERDVTKLERMAGRLNIEPGSVLLDVGTGTGVFLPHLLDRIGKDGRIVALDIAEEMLLKSLAKGYNGKIDYLCADITNIPLDGGIFDAVVCYSSFPHFHDKPRALAEVKRVLKRGGRVLICHTSSRTHINEIHRQVPVVQNDIIPDEIEMQKILSMAGLVDIIIEDGTDSYLVTAMRSVVQPG